MTTTTPAAALTDAEVAAWRRRFPILERSTYLINNSLGAMPATVPASLQAYTDAWASHGVEAWGEWFAEVRRVADRLAGLLGAPAGSVVVHQNVATLLAMVLSALDFRDRRNGVVFTDADWPSSRYQLAGHRQWGARLCVVETDGISIDTERVLAAIDERTMLVAISHVLFRSSAIVDVAAVVERAHEVGAYCLVDGYHAVGHLPVDVTALGVDFYVGGSVKWLCGGSGCCYLYIRPDLHDRLRPRDVGWLGHATPFAFVDDFEPAAGAMGWLGGTPSIPALYAAREGHAAIAEVTPARIRATSLPLTSRLVEGALERGIAVRSPLEPERRAGAVTLDLGPGTEAASRRLIAAGILVDYRPGAGIRVGPHFFSTRDEIDALLAALDG